MSDLPLELPYRPSPGKPVLGIVFFGAAAALFLWKLTQPTASVRAGGIELEGVAAQGMLVLLTLGALAFVLLGLAQLAAAFLSKKTLVLDETHLHLPRGLLARTRVTVPRASVRKVRVSELAGNRFARVTHAESVLTIPLAMLPTEADGDRLLAALQADAKRR